MSNRALPITFDIQVDKAVFEKDEGDPGTFEKLKQLIDDKDCLLGFQHPFSYQDIEIPVADVLTLFHYEFSRNSLLITIKGTIELEISKKLRKAVVTSVDESGTNFFAFSYIGKGQIVGVPIFSESIKNGFKVVLD